MSRLVTDASPWIDYFAGSECSILEAGLLASAVEIPALVKTELLGNVLSAKDRKALERALEAVPVVGTEASHFLRAARLKAALGELGISLSARDAHVLQCALDRGAVLISRDPLFSRIQKSSGVRVQMW